MPQRGGLFEPTSADRIEFRVVDESLARALYQGIPAARLLARTRPAADDPDVVLAWESHLHALLGVAYDRVGRAIARHARVALDEPMLPASESTIAVLSWAVACASETEASLAEIAPDAVDSTLCDSDVLAKCAAYERRLADPFADKRAAAFEACVRLATRAVFGPLSWHQVHANALQLERIEPKVRLLGPSANSIFPRRVDDEIAPNDRRMTALDRRALDDLVAKDPRSVAAVLGVMENGAGAAARLATFLADLSRLLVHEGTLVAALVPLERRESDDMNSPAREGAPTEWTASTAALLADALERGVTTLPRVRAAAERGGEAALDVLGAEMLDVGVHASASAAFADILSRSARPRDVLRLVTYFAIAPDPVSAARVLGACVAAELPHVLGAWLDAMLPRDGDDAPESGAARVSACIASLRPYPQLYRVVRPLLTRLDAPCAESAFF